MRTNAILQKLRDDQQAFGVAQTIGSPIIAEELAVAGFDWIFIDAQHGYWSHESLVSTIQVISHTETVPIVRPPANTPPDIGRVLDAGAMGVIVPMVNSPDEAKRAVDAVRYPPQGTRSAGGSRLMLYGNDYFTGANDEILLAVMIETKRAVEQAEAILSVPGVDCGFIGPGDLAIDLGTFGETSEVHEQAIQRTLDDGIRAGVPMGIACGSPETAQMRIKQGFRLVDTGSDIAYLWNGIRQAQKAIADFTSPEN